MIANTKRAGALLLAGAVMAGAVMAGCSGPEKTDTPRPTNNAAANAMRSDRPHLCDTSLPESEYTDRDTNNDGRPDVTRVFIRQSDETGSTHAILVCAEVDLDHNGKSDVLRKFDAKTGQVTEEREDRNFDGLMDAFTQYAAGQITEQVLDNNQDGVFDTRIFYRDWCYRRDGAVEPCELTELRMTRMDRQNNEMANVKRVRLPYRTEQGRYEGGSAALGSNAGANNAAATPQSNPQTGTQTIPVFDDAGVLIGTQTVTSTTVPATTTAPFVQSASTSVTFGTWVPSYWAFYDEKGAIVRIGWDENGDHRPDRWDRVDRLTNLHTTDGSQNWIDAGVRDGAAPAVNTALPTATNNADAGGGG